MIACLGRLFRRKVGIATMVVLALLLIYAGLIEPNWVQVNNVEVRIADLPAAFDGFRIVQLSDLHFHGPRKTLSPTYLRVARMVNHLSPGLIAVTGDVLSYSSGEPLAHDFLSRLHAKHGIYLVWGNWDQDLAAGLDPVRKDFSSLGVRILEDEGEPLTVAGQEIWVLGVPWSEGPAGHTQRAYADAARKGYGGGTVILLSHSPVVWQEAVAEKTDLVLCGHTHGGQIWLPLVTRLQWTRKPYPPFYRGLHQVGKTNIYINRGIGTSWLPFRFLARPEISVIILRCGA